jgi:muramoyltetrapeptide carboxypeptidase
VAIAAVFPGVYEKDGYLAGSDEVRLNDLHALPIPKSTPSSACAAATARRACLTARFRAAARQPKPFVGYSDITALHLAISRMPGL